MAAPKLVLTALTAAALSATPAVASGGANCPDWGGCRIAVNHSEALVSPMAR